MLKDATFHELLNFFDAADTHGKHIVTQIDDGVKEEDPAEKANHNVSFEARLIKKIFLRLRE